MGRGGRLLRQVLLAVALAAFVVACLRLGWWQLQRYGSPSGSLQNLGYTLQWPTFALFAIFMVWRLRKLERERNAERDATPAEPRDARAPRAARTQPRARPDEEPDEELAAYNRYLAELNAAELEPKEQHRGR